ncbi:protein phosphatase 1 regulatory subunit 3A [Enoplosus armatus]|uniref:protein phosphatase 1 regulatory subunit 3A n=1 Tax=Enoplosus armatus TaxID=215367 RepID=UPI00399552A9
MLNVSCQKQKHCSSLPADSLTESPMEFLGQPGPSGACNLLGVPGLSTLDVDDDEGEVVINIRPKSSPLPRRKSSVSDEDSEPEPPLCGSRRVSFADAKGLSLVQVKEFDMWDVPKLPGYDSSEGEGKDAEEYFLSPLTFSLPLSTKELFVKVREQKVELETLELLPGTTILKGVIRVLNISFTKAVYVRTTLDTWSSHFDLLAEYIPGSSEGLMDCFSFKLTLVPPFGEQGARVDFCLRYETPVGTFWTNNNNKNYVLFCHQRVKEKPWKENVNKKSCLKTVGQNFSTVENISAMEASSQENISTDVSKHAEERDTMKAKQISDGQSGASEENGQKLLTESRRNCSRRSRRKAARMARVRDYFAQRGGGAKDAERDESPPEAKQTAQEESPEEKRSYSEGSSKSDDSQFVSESLETCRKPLLDVVHDSSPAHDYTSNSEPEKSESINLADSATLTGGESATDIPDNSLHSNDEPAPAESQHINLSVSKAEESSQKQGMSYECTSNIGAEPADSVNSAVSSESLVCQTSSFTFGTVVAPLYRQVFGRVGSESQNEGFCVDTAEVKNWEMMVEEEEKNILTDEEENEAIRLKAEDIEAVEKEIEQLEDAGIETALENTGTTEKEKRKTEAEMVGKITAARDKENKAEIADVLEDKQNIGEEEIREIVAGKDREEFEKELEYVQANKREKTAGEKELAEEVEVEKREEQEKTEEEKHFAEIQEINIERTNVQEEEEIEGEEEMEMDFNNEDEAGVEWEDRAKPKVENVEEENPDCKEEILVDETGASEIVDAESESKTIEDRENEVGCFEERLDIIQNKVEDGLSALVNNVQDKRVIDKENTGGGQNARLPNEMHLYKEEDFQSNENVTHDLSKAARDENESTAAEGGSCIFADEPESDQTSHDSASAESDSDDEVELYMHCLRAVHTGSQAHKDRSKDIGFSVGKRPSVSRSKLLSTPMPSISESLDEEQHLSRLQDNHEDTVTADIQPTAAALTESSGQESINRNVSWWIETFSCSNISKTLLYATLLVVFLVVAYHYDFLACFGLYLISVIWLCCQGERQPVKSNNRIG